MSMKKEYLSRRELIKRFGAVAFLLHPLIRSMAHAASSPYASAPRFVMFFKGGSYYPSRTNPAGMTISTLASTSAGASPLAPLQAHAQDLILFRNMSIHGGSPKSNGYQEEHGAGLFGCTTGNSYKYTKNDAYYAYTDFQSIDVAIANHYKSRADLSGIPFASLHLGAGAHSDADSVGLGQRYISFRNRQTGDTTYGNAIEPIQDAGQVYDQLMSRINLICTKQSNQPTTDTNQLRAALARKKSILDLKFNDINDAKRVLGLDSEHSRKLDGLVDGWRQTENLILQQQAALDSAPPSTSTSNACPSLTRPTGNGTNKKILTGGTTPLSPIHDQMISLIKLAFQWDLTRVVAFTLSGASSGQQLTSSMSAHHSLEHNGDVNALVQTDSYYSEKFALLLQSLKSIDDGLGQTALYNSSVVLGMECWSNSSSNHYLTNIPFVFAGQGGGRFKTGQVIDAKNRNNNDLLISCQNAAGITSSTFGLTSLCAGPILPTT